MAIAVPGSLIAILALLALTAAPVQANGGSGGSAGGGQTVEEQFPLSNYVLINLCNTDVVNMQGEMYISVTTSPARNGGYTVQSTASAPDLTGATVPPQPYVAYTGDDVETSHSYYAPPPYPSTIYDEHWTKLVPLAPAPTMYLVVVFREVILANVTPVPAVQGTYLACSTSQKVPHGDDGS